MARIGGVRTYWLSLVAGAVIFLAYSRVNSFAAALVLFFILGFPSVASSVALGPLLVQVSPPAMIGRIVSVFYPSMAMARLISSFLSGFLASVLGGFHASLLSLRVGPIDTIFTGAGLLCLLAGLWTAWQLRETPDVAAVSVAVEST